LVNLIGVQVPVEVNENDTQAFYKELKGCVNNTGRADCVVTGGERNGRVGDFTISELLGTYGENRRQNNAKQLIQF
jgi:hypothetical protein